MVRASSARTAALSSCRARSSPARRASSFPASSSRLAAAARAANSLVLRSSCMRARSRRSCCCCSATRWPCSWISCSFCRHSSPFSFSRSRSALPWCFTAFFSDFILSLYAPWTTLACARSASRAALEETAFISASIAERSSSRALSSMACAFASRSSTAFSRISTLDMRCASASSCTRRRCRSLRSLSRVDFASSSFLNSAAASFSFSSRTL
mmetsp:Transcript_20675/g.65417  ORF Transcript_20675/g.65417 Transcript_20675/m.65417 type:complete len:213 (+) Transcript_20675:610-1248(+)